MSALQPLTEIECEEEEHHPHAFVAKPLECTMEDIIPDPVAVFRDRAAIFENDAIEFHSYGPAEFGLVDVKVQLYTHICAENIYII